MITDSGLIGLYRNIKAKIEVEINIENVLGKEETSRTVNKAIIRFVITENLIAPSKPNSGIKKKPAKSEPIIAPTVFHEYTKAVPIPVASLLGTSMCTANGNVAPINIVAGSITINA